MKKDKIYILLDGVLFQLPRCRGPSVGLAHSWVRPPPPEIPGVTEANDETAEREYRLLMPCVKVLQLPKEVGVLEMTGRGPERLRALLDPQLTSVCEPVGYLTSKPVLFPRCQIVSSHS